MMPEIEYGELDKVEHMFIRVESKWEQKGEKEETSGDIGEC